MEIDDPPSVTLDGERIDLDSIAPPPMNFGQLERWSQFAPRRYEFTVPTSVFIAIGQDWFESFRVEIRDDDRLDPPGHGTPEWEFMRLDYPKLGELVLLHPSVCERLFLQMPLELANLFAPESAGKLRYSLNSVDEIVVSTDAFRFSGIAYDAS